jgi:hypothetical protein
MTRRITLQTTLDNLTKEAKRWLNEPRANVAGRARAVSHRAFGPILQPSTNLRGTSQMSCGGRPLYRFQTRET